MSDGQGEQLAEPELLSLAQALTEHSAMVRADAYRAWLDRLELIAEPDSGAPFTTAEGFSGGWSAALEWYIGLVTRPPLEQLALEQIAASVQVAAGRSGQLEATEPWLCSSCGSGPMVAYHGPGGIWHRCEACLVAVRL